MHINTPVKISFHWTFNVYVVTSGTITSINLTFNSTIGVWGSTIAGQCHAQFTVNVSGCVLRFDYGFVTKEAPAGRGLELYNILLLSPVNVSSAGEYTCTVSVIDTTVCSRNISPKSSAAVTLKVQCA